MQEEIIEQEPINIQSSDQEIDQDAPVDRTPLRRQFTTSEALFVYEGLAFKGSALQDLGGKITSHAIKKNLMTMDLRFDTLSEYLMSFSDVINQHGVMLNDVKADTEKKTYIKDLDKYLQVLVDSHHVHDPSFSKKITLQDISRLDEKHYNPTQAISHKMGNKISKMCTGLDLLYTQNEELFDRMERAELRCRQLEETKSDRLELKSQNDKLISLIMTKADEIQKLVFEKIELNYSETRKEIQEMATRVQDCEGKTLEKIRDMEALLKLRASKEYVDTKAEALQEELKRSLEGFNSDNSSRITDWRMSTEESIKLIREEIDMRLEETSFTLKEIQSTVLTRVESSLFIEMRKSHDKRIEDLAFKMVDFNRKFDQVEAKIKNTKNSLKSKIETDDDKLKSLIKELQKKLKVILDRMQSGEFGSGGGGEGGMSGELFSLLKKELQCDSHKPLTEGGQIYERIQTLEEDSAKMKDQLSRFGPQLENVQADVANKIDLSTFTNQLGKKVDRDEFIDMISKINTDTDKSRKIEKEVQRLRKKMNENIEALDKKFKKLRKDVDIAYIQKLLQSKASITDMKREVLRVEDVVKDNQGVFNSLRNDFEKLVVSFKKIAQFIAQLQEEEAQGTLASTKSALCLSCGRGGTKFRPESKHVSLLLLFFEWLTNKDRLLESMENHTLLMEVDLQKACFHRFRNRENTTLGQKYSIG